MDVVIREELAAQGINAVVGDPTTMSVEALAAALGNVESTVCSVREPKATAWRLQGRWVPLLATSSRRRAGQAIAHDRATLRPSSAAKPFSSSATAPPR